MAKDDSSVKVPTTLSSGLKSSIYSGVKIVSVGIEDGEASSRDTDLPFVNVVSVPRLVSIVG